MSAPMTGPSVVLKPRALDRIRAHHPWIYRSDIGRVDAEAGALVAVVDHRGRVRGHALYSSRSEIALRMVRHGTDGVDRAYWAQLFDRAIALRRDFFPDADALRLVYSEGDGLPGLIVDRYGDVVVLQTLTQGMDALKAMWVELIAERLSPRAIVERNDVGVRRYEGLPTINELLAGEEPGEVEIHQGPAKLLVNPRKGQKTGAFLDQRENREAAAAVARGEVLDAFTFEGHFGVRLSLVEGVNSVLAIDSSADALARARANVDANEGAVHVELREGNAFDALRAMDDEGRAFDTIVLDPPAFAKNKASVEGALRGYKEINLRALRMLRPGGHLITCSCSYHVHDSLFLQTVAEAAGDAGRNIMLMERRTQGRDHPVRLTIPETFYLKCLVLRAV